MIVRRSFQIEGRKVSYLTVDGVHAAETLLLIHGAGVSARTWVSQLRGLPRDVTPIALDLPGHRDSDPVSDPSLEAYAETAYQAIEHLQRGPVFIAGHSLGGAVAQLLAMRHPEQVKGLILISTCAKVPPGDGTQRLLGLVPAPFRRVVFLSAVRKTLLAPSASQDAIGLTLEEVGGCRSRTIQDDTAIGRRMDMADVAGGLRVPTLILCGARDRLTAPELSQELSAMIAGSRLQIVPFAGHMLPLEAPDIVNHAISEFVTSVTRAPQRSSTARRPFLDRLGGWRPWRAWRQHFR